MKAPRFGHDDAAAAVWRAAGAYGWRPLPPCVEVRAWSAPVVITRDALDAAPVLDLAEMLGRDALAQSDAAFRAFIASLR